MPLTPKPNPVVVDWTPRSDKPRRSVFGNYHPSPAPVSEEAVAGEGNGNGARAPAGASVTLQSAIDLAFARSFIYALLSRGFEDPTGGSWPWLCDRATGQNLLAAWKVVSSSHGDAPALDSSEAHDLRPNADEARALCACPTFAPEQFDAFHTDYLAAFGHAARGRCPPNEIEYGDIKADPLYQPHRLADLAAFYRAFGLELAEDASERHDHICLELEFMAVLAAKETFALERQADAPNLAVCRDAQKKFLREHLARWLPAFTRRLADMVGDGALASLAGFTRRFILTECARFKVDPGGDDLLLRPADTAAGSMCESCGLAQLPPGAANPAAASM